MTKQEELQLKIKKKCQEDLLAFSIATDKNFIPYWHHRLIAEKLEAVERGDIKRLIITLPPRSGKSFLITEKFPTWFLGKNPGKEAIVVSYSAELAEAFGFKSRDLVRGENYGAIFDTKLRDDSKAKDKWNLSNGSQYKAVGFNGSLTGHGGHVIIIDDPIKNNSEAESFTFREGQWTWYTSTLYTRLYANAPVVLVMTRWHLDDLAGRLVEQQKYGGDMWEVINIPALAMQDETYMIKGKEHTRKRGGAY